MKDDLINNIIKSYKTNPFVNTASPFRSHKPSETKLVALYFFKGSQF